MIKEFEFTTPLMDGKEWIAELLINGTWEMQEGLLMVQIESVKHNSNQYEPKYTYIPQTFWTWLNSDKIEEIAYQHCLGLKEEERLGIDDTEFDEYHHDVKDEYPDISPDHTIQVKGGEEWNG